MPARDFAVNGAGDDVARRKLRVRMHRRHKAPAGLVDQDGAFAAERFGGERRRIAADSDSGGMELHELGIGDDRPAARRHPDPFAARLQRVGRQAIKRADAAGGEDHRQAAEQHQPRVRSRAVAREYSRHAAVLYRQLQRVESLAESNRWRSQGALGKNTGDFGTGAVASDVDDAGGGVRRLAPERERAVRFAIERRAQFDQIANERRCFTRDDLHDVRIARSPTRRDGIGGMGLPAVAFVHRRGDAALSPGARAGIARPRAGDDKGRKRGKLQRGKKPGDAGAQNERAFAFDDVVRAHCIQAAARCLGAPTASIRSTAALARAAVAASTVTSCVIV